MMTTQKAVFDSPLPPYTQALVSAVLRVLQGEVAGGILAEVNNALKGSVIHISRLYGKSSQQID